MKRKIIVGTEAKEQLLEGAKLLYTAVSTTLGPKGQNGVIEAYGEPIVTHDGVTVAKSISDIEDASPGARVGIEMIKASSSKTNDNVGDGTTSSTILAYHLMEQGMELIKDGKNAMVLRRELDEAAKEALTHLEELKQPIKTERDAVEIATISSENKEVGKQVGSMLYRLGKNGLVTVETGNKPDTQYNIIEGYTFDRGVINPMMITDHQTQTTTIENPGIILAQSNVGLRDVINLLDSLYNEGKDGVVIICDDMKNDLQDEAIRQFNKIKVIGVKAPGFGDNRGELLKDIGALTGAKAVGGKLRGKVSELTLADVGTCDKIVITPKETVITGGKDVSDYIKTLEAKLEVTEGEFEKDKVEKRIAQLHAKIGQIQVGGNTEMEAEERKYLIDDAVAATEAAVKDGIVPGGGTTYVELSRRLKSTTDGSKLLKNALQAPFKVLMENAGERSGLKLSELKDYGSGFDVMGTGDLIDLREHGIIDPVLVIKQAITNATSVAGSALTTGVIITTEKDKDEKEEE